MLGSKRYDQSWILYTVRLDGPVVVHTFGGRGSPQFKRFCLSSH